ncbi:uncharacterized protein LAESUDRAFT_660846 [Laetiporus sulphureus 93-53]|uniref:Uncharacterized protein n=1 Tax=Laetiporus sulphureus 93-53 TaxID=1314785 RepID=A0A165CGU3_9APHY|nr:uncharacterized protein LAESUDRAFT_660846 [Laetiporus sulphureus 93-53]KZT02781.1 hypothetical protein LAESUDRAFT_660846 [Laetiporus sulphureus 93-53]
MDDEPNQAEIITLYNLNSSGDAYRTNRMFWSTLHYTGWSASHSTQVEFMWRGRFVWTRILYFAVIVVVLRQIPILPCGMERRLLNIVCKFWFNWFLYAYLLSRIIISAILIMRLYVMYRCDRRLLVGLCVLFLLEFATESAIICDVIYSLEGQSRMVHNDLDVHLSSYAVIGLRSQLTGCIAIPTRSWAWAYWVPVLVFESVLFALSVIKTVQQSREDTSTPYLMMVLIRDSMFYFGGALAAILANFIVWKTQVSK